MKKPKKPASWFQPTPTTSSTLQHIPPLDGTLSKLVISKAEMVEVRTKLNWVESPKLDQRGHVPQEFENATGSVKMNSEKMEDGVQVKDLYKSILLFHNLNRKNIGACNEAAKLCKEIIKLKTLQP